MDLMQITNGNNSLYVYIKDFNRFMCNKKKRWTKKPFADIVCSILVVNYQLAVPFKICADGNASFTKKYQEHIPCRFAYKNVCIDDRFRKPVVLYKGKNLVHKFIARILNEYEYCRRVVIKQFNKNLS